MSGQRKNYSEYKKGMDEFIKTHPPYAPSKPCNVDLRAFSKYVKNRLRCGRVEARAICED